MPPKRDRRINDVPGKKKARKSITMEKKMDILRRYDRGESTAAIYNTLNLPESILRTIRKDREKITAAIKAGTGNCAKKVSMGKSTVMVRMEKMLVTWMNHRKRQGLNVTFDDTKKKAMECYNHLKKEGGRIPEFNASTGWFYEFKTRYGFHNVKRLGEAKSADEDAAAAYSDCLRAIIEEVCVCVWGGCYKPQLIFNMDETDLQWKKKCLNVRTSRGRRSLPKASRHLRSVTLLLGANLMGDSKLKPFLVYHAENTRALKGYDKTSLPVHWFASSSGWMTGHIFKAYSKTQLVHELKEYCTSQGLPFRILMVLDNALAHSQVLQDLHQDIKFVFLPFNTTSLLQPMDQGVIKMFKAHYLQRSRCSFSMKCDVSSDEFEKAAQAPEKTNVELQKDMVQRHWESYTICDALWHVCDAWKEMTKSCIQGAWKKLCPHLTVDFGGFDLTERLSKERIKCLELIDSAGSTAASVGGGGGG